MADRYSVDEVAAMLEVSYAAEVEGRGRAFERDAHTAEMLGLCARWLCTDKNFGLLLYGSVGNGKSTMGMAIRRMIGILYNASISTERKGVYYMTALGIEKAAAAQSRTFEEAKSTEILLIDDMGTENVSVKVWGNEQSPVTEVIYARYEKQLCTIVTSNLSDDEIRERYGARIADRMEEMFARIFYRQKSYRPNR